MIVLVSDVYLGPKDLDEKVAELHLSYTRGEDSQSLRKNNQITSVFSLKSLSRSSTTVIETHGSVEGDLIVSMPTARSREFGNSSLIELIRSVRALCGLRRTCVDWHCQSKMD